jgi:hypothetical protein
MKYLFYNIIFLLFLACGSNSGSVVVKEKSKELRIKPITIAQSENFQLSKPIIEIDSLFFKNSCVVSIKQSEPNTIIYYTVDNTEPDSTSLIYDGSIVLKQSGSLKVKAIHPELKSSETISQKVIKVKSNDLIKEIILVTSANEQYPGGGASSFIDLQKGSLNFKEGKEWSGFQKSNVEIKIKLKRTSSLKSIHLSCLRDHGSWIFLPASITCNSNNTTIGEKIIPEPLNNESSCFSYLSLPLDKNVVSEINIQIESLNAIPDWHPGKGSMPWLFIDEVILE